MLSLLQRRSDGAYETSDGLFAVKLKIISGAREQTNWFEFKSSPMAPIIRVEWPVGAPFALLPQETAKALVRAGYADTISDQEMDLYNKAVNAGEEGAPKGQSEVQVPQPESPVPSWVSAATESTEPAPTSILPQGQPSPGAPIPPPITTTAPVAEPVKPVVSPVTGEVLKPI